MQLPDRVSTSGRILPTLCTGTKQQIPSPKQSPTKHHWRRIMSIRPREPPVRGKGRNQSGVERESEASSLKIKLETREQRLTPTGGGTALLRQPTSSDSLVAKPGRSTPFAINDGWPYHCHKPVPAFHVSTYHGLLNSNSSRRWNKVKSILSGPVQDERQLRTRSQTRP